MKFFTNKIRTAFGNISEIKATDVEDFTEDIINSIDKTAFARSDQNVMYVDNKELGGYYYLLTIIVGSFKIKTKKGAKLILNGKDFKLELNSDMDEFESENITISNSNRFITRIDFQIEKEEISKIDKNLISKVLLTTKKHQILFTTL